MSSVLSATTWGSPTATKHALLIHGLSSSSHTWQRVASSLAAQGFLVAAPSLIGHASRVAPDYHLTSIAEDLRPYLAKRNYSLVIGHSLGSLAVMALFSHLPPSHPTAIVLVEPPMDRTPERLDFIDRMFSESCINVKPAEVYSAENPLWSRENCISRELGTRLSSVEAIHGILNQNRPWRFFDYLDSVSDKWKVTVLVADPAFHKLCSVEELHPYPHVRPVVVAGAGHWIQHEFPEMIVEEALKMVAELDSGV